MPCGSSSVPLIVALLVSTGSNAFWGGLCHRCSGDDGVNVCGGAKPIFHDCTIQVCSAVVPTSAVILHNMHRCLDSVCSVCAELREGAQQAL